MYAEVDQVEEEREESSGLLGVACKIVHLGYYISALS